MFWFGLNFVVIEMEKFKFLVVYVVIALYQMSFNICIFSLFKLMHQV